LVGADVVIHLATRGYSTSQPPTASELEAERLASVELVRDAADSGVSRFIFISSIHVYGDALIGAVTGSTSPQPTTDYGRSRLQLERELTRQSETTAMTRVVLRMANTFGIPAMTQPATWDLLVHDLCRQAVVSNRLVLHSNGTGYRNFLALSDAVSVIAEVATDNVPSGTYVLAGPKTYRLRDVAELVRVRAELLLGKSLTVEVSSTDMTHHQPFTFNDTSLRAFGISMQDNLVSELDQLIRAADQEFGDHSS
jgi:UDP-glucose 4-epimerase